MTVTEIILPRESFCDSEIQKNVSEAIGLCFQGENSSADFFSFLSLSYQHALKWKP